MFLGGKTRFFTDDFPPEYTNVGFHGHYDSHDDLDAALVRRTKLKEWIIQYSDGKADPDLVERWINLPHSNDMIHFFNPALFQRDGASTFLCQASRSLSSPRELFRCEPIRKTALDLGIVTSLELVHSNDRAAHPSDLLHSSRPTPVE
jgi:hypothetical protein